MPGTVRTCQLTNLFLVFSALENKAPLEVVKLLISKDPDAVILTQYKLGRTPVHAAVSNGAPLNVVEYVLELRPLAVGERDAWGKTPLACACMNAGPDDPNAAAVLYRLIDPTRIRKASQTRMVA